ncbi:hydrogenase expression/formation protein HypE [bacterium]|nr:hydrogenase expression/formation protein HypE [bacterium]
MSANEKKSTHGSCPLPFNHSDVIRLSHGAGGQMTSNLIRDVILRHFGNPILDKLGDSAELHVQNRRLAFTTDSFVVNPLFFPGGNIGDLAVNGTVNDLAVSGARALYLSIGFIIEEGLAVGEFDTIVETMQRAAGAAGVTIVTGDTKVVDHGKGDKIFINTSGIGVFDHDFILDPRHVEPSDVVIVSGPIGNHGIAVLSKREGFSFGTDVVSDTAPLGGLTEALLRACGNRLRVMRDPTRGGIAASLNEFAERAQVEIELDETSLPIDPPVAGACELLGIDPLHVANEGKLVVIVAAELAEEALAALRELEIGREACVIGRVGGKRAPGRVVLRTLLGVRRVVDPPVGEQLPRIC